MLFRRHAESWKEIPAGIRTAAVATGIRWIGWGICEPLIPVFLFSLVRNYRLPGLLDSIGDIGALLLLPLLGLLADRVPLRKLFLGGLTFFYLSVFYIASGLTGMITFFGIGSFFEGIGAVTDSVARATTVRRYAPQGRIAFAFGFVDAISATGWILGMALSLLLVKIIPLAWIFVFIVPMNFIAMLIYKLRFPNERLAAAPQKQLPVAMQYKSAWVSMYSAARHVRFLIGLAFFFQVLGAIATFVVPIYAYANGASLQKIVILGVILFLPTLFSSFLGKLVDAFTSRVLWWGMPALVVSIVALGYTSRFAALLSMVFILAILLIILGLEVDRLITQHTQSSAYGQVSAALEGVMRIGKIAGPFSVGLLVDMLGNHSAFLGIAGMALTILIIMAMNKKQLVEMPKPFGLADTITPLLRG